jgi:CO/xanthine dehydrogenase FAD-binding subunit
MIPFDFVYLQPGSIEEAVSAFAETSRAGLDPLYYGGGTEIVTFSRDRIVHPGAVIDIKRIPECRELRVEGDSVVLGAAVALNRIIESGLFPLLGRAAAGIADHTVRNRLTLGGNVAGRLPYREAVLSLLLSEAHLVLVGPNGRRTVGIREVFSKRLKLEEGELLVQAKTAVSTTKARWRHVRREKGTRTDYPLVSVGFLELDGTLRVAASGLLAFPFRDDEVEKALNETRRTAEKRADEALKRLPGEVRDDQRGSAEYRSHLFRKIIVETVEEMEKSS